MNCPFTTRWRIRANRPACWSRPWPKPKSSGMLWLSCPRRDRLRIEENGEPDRPGALAPAAKRTKRAKRRKKGGRSERAARRRLFFILAIAQSRRSKPVAGRKRSQRARGAAWSREGVRAGVGQRARAERGGRGRLNRIWRRQRSDFPRFFSPLPHRSLNGLGLNPSAGARKTLRGRLSHEPLDVRQGFEWGQNVHGRPFFLTQGHFKSVHKRMPGFFVGKKVRVAHGK